MTLIPPIKDATLEDLAKKIKPVFRFVTTDGYKHTPIDVGDERYVSADLLYVKLPRNLRKVGGWRQLVPESPAGQLKELTRIETYHVMCSLFNPSVAEVLAQIPPEYIDGAVAFEVTRPFPHEVVHKGMNSFHKTTIILYGKE